MITKRTRWLRFILEKLLLFEHFTFFVLPISPFLMFVIPSKVSTFSTNLLSLVVIEEKIYRILFQLDRSGLEKNYHSFHFSTNFVLSSAISSSPYNPHSTEVVLLVIISFVVDTNLASIKSLTVGLQADTCKCERLPIT